MWFSSYWNHVSISQEYFQNLAFANAEHNITIKIQHQPKLSYAVVKSKLWIEINLTGVSLR